jgi:hypothetical protein
MFSLLDLLLGFAGLTVPAAITLACWRLVAGGARTREQVAALRPQQERPLVHAGNRPQVGAEPALESR